MRDYDVVIAGFGPTGAMAANMLGQHQINTLIVDPQSEIYDIPRGVHFDGETMRIFQSLGLADTILAQCAVNDTLNFVNRHGASLMRADLKNLPLSAGWPADIFFRQPLVEQHLRENLKKFDSVTQDLGWAVNALVQHEDHVELTLRHVKSGDTKTVTTAYLVGADGADSAVRELAGIALHDLQCDEPWLVVDWELEPGVAFNRDVYQFCDPARPGTLVPCAGQHIRWEFMMNPDDDRATMEHEDTVRAMMAPYVGHLSPDISARQGKILRSKVYQFHALLAERMADGRVFLMGDAAHQMPPFLGQGMCAGMRDAENLSWKLAGVLQKHYAPSILSSYHSERYAHVRAVIKQAVQIGEIIQTRNPVKAFLRDTFLRLGKIIPKLLSGIQFGQTWQLGAGLLSDDKMAGRQIPQPLIRQNPQQDMSQKLDTYLPDGFCLLTLSPAYLPELQNIGAAVTRIECPVIALGDGSDDGLIEADTELSDMGKQLNIAAVLVRPDRQIYATLKNEGAPLAAQFEMHLTTLSAQLFADGDTHMAGKKWASDEIHR